MERSDACLAAHAEGWVVHPVAVAASPVWEAEGASGPDSSPGPVCLPCLKHIFPRTSSMKSPSTTFGNPGDEDNYPGKPHLRQTIRIAGPGPIMPPSCVARNVSRAFHDCAMSLR